LQRETSVSRFWKGIAPRAALLRKPVGSAVRTEQIHATCLLLAYWIRNGPRSGPYDLPTEVGGPRGGYSRAASTIRGCSTRSRSSVAMEMM